MRMFIKERRGGHYRQYATARQFIVTLPNIGEPGEYRQVLSMEAFSTYWKKRLYRSHVNRIPEPDPYFFCRREDEVQEEDERHRQSGYPQFTFFQDSIEVHHCASVWEFYDAIGWDYKKKHFTKN